METGFFGKILLAILAGFAAACLVAFYQNFIDGAYKALNEGYENRGFKPQ